MLKIKFSWRKGEDNNFYPGGQSSFEGDYSNYVEDKIKYFFNEISTQNKLNYKDCLGYLFIDDGGVGWKRRIPFIENGIKKIEKVLSNLSEEEDWGGEGFLAEIKKEGALIYFITDDSYFDIISLKCFYKAMVSWRKFLDTEPNENTIMEIECEEE